MRIRQSIQLAQRPRSSSGEPSQQRIVDDFTALFNVANRLITELDSQNLRRVAVPATSGGPGEIGDFAIDTNHVYFCVAASTWKRIALTTF